MVKLFDTLSRELKEVVQGDDKSVKIYACGPTVYGPAHIGNFITFTRADILYRMLKVAGLNPYYCRNITDVDDKTIRRSQEEKTSLIQFTEKWTQIFHEDCDKLNLLKPDIEPKATGHIQEQIDIIQKLIDKGHAYATEDASVYFKVSSFPAYGKLSHFDPSELISQDTNSAGQANQADEYDRESVSDFALWKGVKEEDGENFWEAPWGKGRPGWHIECSAMSMKYLGETFDLHMGGEDLCFPHHENEIAQSEAATGKPFCKHWMHSTHLMVEGKKMSKSLGNFFVLNDLIEKGYSPSVIRMAFLNGHYRQQLNFTFDGLNAASSALNTMAELLLKILPEGGDLSDYKSDEWPADFGMFSNSWKALTNDLNTPACLGALFSALKKLAKKKADFDLAEELKSLNAIIFALGIEVPLQELREKIAEKENFTVPAEIQELAQRRWDAKQAKDWANADALRQALTDKGWKALDSKEGFSLEPL